MVKRYSVCCKELISLMYLIIKVNAIISLYDI